MADKCSKLDTELAEIDAELRALDRIEDQIKGKAAARADAPRNDFRTFSMVDGTKVRTNPMEFWKEVERMRIGAGDEVLRAEVMARFEGGFKPKGSKGLSINYGQLPFDDEHKLALLEMAGLRRRESKAGRELMMPFTAEVAKSQIAGRLALAGGTSEDIARDLARRIPGYDKLPVDMVMSQLMRNDSVDYLSNLLLDASDMMDSFGVPTAVEAQLARAAQYVNFYEEIDAALSRKVAQALQSRNQKKFRVGTIREAMETFGDDIGDFDIYEDVRKLNASTLEPGSLADQIQNAINKGDAPALKKIALAKRFDATRDVPLNQRNFMTEVELLNSYRKENLFSSSATLLQRNTGSAGVVSFVTAAEDVSGNFWKSGDLQGTYLMSKQAAENVYSGFGTAWRNATEFLNTGVPTYTKGGVIEDVAMSKQVTRKLDVEADLNDAWETMFNLGDSNTYSPFTKAVTFFRWMNASSRWVIGNALERAPGIKGTTAGYQPVWALMGTSDEIIKKMSFDWASSIESTRIANELYDGLDVKPDGLRSEWVSAKSEELTEKAVFSGLMTNDEMAVMRRDLGTRQQGDMSDEVLRLQHFNDQAGLPDPSSPSAQAGIRRGEENTFTQAIEGGFGIPETIDNARKRNTVFSWIMPVFQTPYNSFKWVLDRDLYVNMARGLYRESVQGAAKVKQGGLGALVPEALGGPDISDFDLPIDRSRMAGARAKATTAIMIAATVEALIAKGMFTDGGPFNQADERDERERNAPRYAFSLGLSYAQTVGEKSGFLPLSRLVMSADGIDIVEIMATQADASRARKEGLISEDTWLNFIQKTAMSYARLLGRFDTMEGVRSLLNIATNTQATGNEKGVRALQGQMSGIFPFSGLLRDMSQGMRDPNLRKDSRRQFSPEEQAKVSWIYNDKYKFIGELYQSVTRDIPLLGELGSSYVDTNWFGRKVKKPWGLPIDCGQPFAPCILEEGSLDKKLDDLGLGGVPVPDGKLGAGTLNRATGIQGKDRFGSATMTREEEKVFRKGMYDTPGSIPAEQLISKGNATITTLNGSYSIDFFVQGNTLPEALDKLTEHEPWLADMRDRGVSADSPEALALPQSEQSMAGRTRAADLSRTNLGIRSPIDVYNAVIDYYEIVGAQQLGLSPEGEAFYERAWSVRPKQVQTERLLDMVEQQPLGLSQQ